MKNPDYTQIRFVAYRTTRFMNPEQATEYRDLLSQIRQEIHDHEWVRVLQQWLNELKTIELSSDWKRHAGRTVRALGGMESIGEIALASR